MHSMLPSMRTARPLQLRLSTSSSAWKRLRTRPDSLLIRLIMLGNVTGENPENPYVNKDTAALSVADVRSGVLPESGRPDLFYRFLLGLLLAAAGSVWVLRREEDSLAKA